ncbi:3250_t:CDS:2 [Cetraspora pellucida]|uniref:3250_t:CDS:1 n=1 Tax=Cetraspora pellucida TaxID=1433469 RepID=A0A9N9EJS9_9GLOM|nr:3250_t:CDS:2 [Cetraspora pellucida]
MDYVKDTTSSKWFAQLTQQKQLLGETVDIYHTSIEKMIKRVELGGHQYPNTAKAQMFINGLCPELYMAVSLLTPNTLEDAYARAKAFENTYRNNPTHMAFMAQPIGYPTYLSQRMVGSSVAPQTNHNKTEEALIKLTETINKMMTQYQDQKRSQ